MAAAVAAAAAIPMTAPDPDPTQPRTPAQVAWVSASFTPDPAPITSNPPPPSPPSSEPASPPTPDAPTPEPKAPPRAAKPRPHTNASPTQTQHTGRASRSHPRTPRSSKPAPPPPTARGVAAVLSWATAQAGKPYRWGATGPDAYDCSGLVQAAYRRVGIDLPHNAAAMLSRGRPVSRAALQPGDLVFTDRHVSIYLGNGRVVEAANRRAGVRIAPIWGFMTARRVT